jgi:hypothetical protein
MSEQPSANGDRRHGFGIPSPEHKGLLRAQLCDAADDLMEADRKLHKAARRYSKAAAKRRALEAVAADFYPEGVQS